MWCYPGGRTGDILVGKLKESLAQGPLLNYWANWFGGDKGAGICKEL